MAEKPKLGKKGDALICVIGDEVGETRLFLPFQPCDALPGACYVSIPHFGASDAGQRLLHVHLARFPCLAPLAENDATMLPGSWPWIVPGRFLRVEGRAFCIKAPVHVHMCAVSAWQPSRPCTEASQVANRRPPRAGSRHRISPSPSDAARRAHDRNGEQEGEERRRPVHMVALSLTRSRRLMLVCTP